MMEFKLTDSKVHTLCFYLEKALIDACGMAAVGICGRTSKKGSGICHGKDRRAE